MKAARLNAGSLEIQDLPTPEPGIEQARIQISSAGVCHSDLHIVRGDWLPGGDELTPTMKLKRKPIAKKYQQEIEGMYAS